MTSVGSRLRWLTACALAASACTLGTEELVIEGVDGECYLDVYGPVIESEEQDFEAGLSCGDSTDCGVRAGVLRGAELGLVIPVPVAAEREQYSVEASDAEALQVDGFTQVYDACIEQYVMIGAVTFRDVGDSSLRVLKDGDELDRFSWKVFDAAAVELQVEDLADDWVTRERYAMERGLLLVRARVANEADERLLAGGDIYWWVDDPDIAALAGGGFSAAGHRQALIAVGVGETTLHVVAGNRESTVTIEVTEEAVEENESEEP